MELHPFTSAYKTLPEDFDEELLSYSVDLNKKSQWPLFKGQSIGTAEIIYDSEKIEDVKLVLDSDEGVDMLSDSARFGVHVFDRLMSNRPAVNRNKSNSVSAKNSPSAPAAAKKATQAATSPDVSETQAASNQTATQE